MTKVINNLSKIQLQMVLVMTQVEFTIHQTFPRSEYHIKNTENILRNYSLHVLISGLSVGKDTDQLNQKATCLLMNFFCVAASDLAKSNGDRCRL